MCKASANDPIIAIILNLYQSLLSSKNKFSVLKKKHSNIHTHTPTKLNLIARSSAVWRCVWLFFPLPSVCFRWGCCKQRLNTRTQHKDRNVTRVTDTRFLASQIFPLLELCGHCPKVDMRWKNKIKKLDHRDYVVHAVKCALLLELGLSKIVLLFFTGS